MRRATFLAAATVLTVAVAATATAQTTTEDHPFEVPGRWTPFQGGGLAFQGQSQATYSSEAARSGSASAKVGFQGYAGGFGQDYGTAGLERVVPLERVDDLAFSFKVTLNDVDGYSEKLKAGVGLELLGPDGESRDEIEYWVASWYQRSPDRPASHDGVVKVSADPAVGRWHRVSVDPAADVPVDWTGTHGVRVTVFTAATWASGDAFVMHVDDLRVAGPASDDPAPAYRAGVPDGEAAAEVPAVTTPGIHEHRVTTAPVTTPATCTQDPCRGETTVATPPASVDRTCVPLAACVGPVDVAGSQNASVPAVCDAADAACRDRMRLLDRQTVETPPVESQTVDAEASAEASAEGPAVGVGQPPIKDDAVGPTSVAPEVPGFGPVEVTVCPFGCPVPGAPGLHLEPGASAEVAVEAAGEEVHAGTPPLP